MHAMLLGALLAFTFLPAEDTKLGSGVTLKDATPIASVVAKPEEFVGKMIRIDGVAAAVCTHMGCWMAVAANDGSDAPTIRLKVEDGVIVFPVSAKGKQVSAEGIFEIVKDTEAKQAAGEHAKQDAKASTEYHIKATGAVIR